MATKKAGGSSRNHLEMDVIAQVEDLALKNMVVNS